MRRFVYADEAGCFSFRRDAKSSKYFIICTVRIDDPSFGGQLLDLRGELIWKGADLSDYFHCSEDKQPVRDEVFALARPPYTSQADAVFGARVQVGLPESGHQFTPQPANSGHCGSFSLAAVRA